MESENEKKDYDIAQFHGHLRVRNSKLSVFQLGYELRGVRLSELVKNTIRVSY